MNPFQNPRLELLVYDFDGTLLDSLVTIAGAVNEVRARHSVVPRSLDEVREAIGQGARWLASRVFADLVSDGHDPDVLFDEYHGIYHARSLAESELYPDVREFLTEAGGRYRQVILTNKPQSITEAVVEVLGLGEVFERVACPESSRALKPDPDSVLELLEELAVVRERALLIGDSVNDFAAGRGAGVVTVGVRGGYYHPGEPEPDLWVEGFGELRGLLDEKPRFQ